MKLKKLLLALGFAAFIPITGCSQFNNVSKNCDELALKYLKTRFEQAAQNNGDYTKHLLVLNSENNELINGSIVTVLYGTFYGVNANGKIEHKSNFTINPGAFLPSKTTPNVATNSQIVCDYPAVYGTRVEKLANGWYDNKVYVTFGTSVTVSEDNNNIYWKDTQ